MVEKTDGLKQNEGPAADRGGVFEGVPKGDTRLKAREIDPDYSEESEGTDQIKARIAETRNQMGETIDAIQDRLSLANISEHVTELVDSAIETAKDSAYDATVGKAVNIMKGVGDSFTQSETIKGIKKNPLPFALIGLGAGLLIYQSFNSRKGRAHDGDGAKRLTPGSRADEASFKFQATRRKLVEVTGRAVDGITGKAGAALETVTHAAGSAYDGVSDAFTGAYSSAGDLANRARERAGEYGTIAHDKYDEYLEENPLAIGAVALAIGAAVGFAIPATPYEGKLMGPARENLMLRAQDAAGEFVDKAKQAANEARQSIAESTNLG